MPNDFRFTFCGRSMCRAVFLAGLVRPYPGLTMSERTYTQKEIEAARASARHVADGIIGIWRAAEGPKAVRLAEQVKDAYEADLRRLLRGAPTLQDHIHAHLNPDHGDLPVCGKKPECRRADSCKNCTAYEDFKDKIRDNFRD
nr:MAG TPA: hypothetical protein [Caudoviricetes sp.]